MRILLIGHDYFKPWLRAAGAEVVQAGVEPGCDLRLDPEEVGLARIVAAIKPRPEVLLLTDDLGQRVLPWGLDQLDLVTVYYGVDAPLNLFWQRHLVGLFDLAALDQKAEAEALSDRLDREVRWLPVGVDPSLYIGPDEAEVYDLAFVGTVSAQVRPKRMALLELLGRRYLVKAAGGRGQEWQGPGESARLYRQARLALNENLFPGLTTRMLEILAAGGCLFTEAAPDGLAELFQSGSHYLTFTPENVLDLADRYLPDRPTRRALAQAGQAECQARHSIARRAQTLLGWLEGRRGDPRPPDPLGLAWTMLLAGSRWPAHAGPRRLARAGLLFREALRRKPGQASARLGLGLAWLAQGRPAEAETELAEAVRVEPSNAQAWLAWGLVLHDLGRSEQGRGSLAQAARLTQAEPGAVSDLESGRLRPGQAGFHLLWGRLLDQAGQGLTPGFDSSRLHPAFWSGLEHFSRAISLAPDDLAALTGLADLLDRHGQSAQAWPLWARAVQLRPQDDPLARRLHQARRAGYAAEES